MMGGTVRQRRGGLVWPSVCAPGTGARINFRTEPLGFFQLTNTLALDPAVTEVHGLGQLKDPSMLPSWLYPILFSKDLIQARNCGSPAWDRICLRLRLPG